MLNPVCRLSVPDRQPDKNGKTISHSACQCMLMNDKMQRDTRGKTIVPWVSVVLTAVHAQSAALLPAPDLRWMNFRNEARRVLRSHQRRSLHHAQSLQACILLKTLIDSCPNDNQCSNYIQLQSHYTITSTGYRRGAHLPFWGHEPVGGDATIVCDAWPVPPIGWYQIILPGDRGTRVNNLPRVVLDSREARIRTCYLLIASSAT